MLLRWVGISMGALVFVMTAWAERVHLVKKNETLGGIANRYGVSVNALQIINGIRDPNLLVSGKKLKIPDGFVLEAPHIVKPGESLSVIASRYRISSSKLAAYNQISKPDLIRVGQKLMIPLGKGGSLPPLLDAAVIKALDKTLPKKGKWKRIVIHHSATNVDDALNMHRVHKARGMANGLAYHFVISNGSRKAKNGEIYIGGRWKNQQDGGHVKRLQWNRESIGICLIGNFELRKPTESQLKSLEGLCRYLARRTGIPYSKITSHKGLHPGHTVCPGKNFSLDAFRKRLATRRSSS
ncbi:MAG: peptidoglycan-binding protein [Opitutae bacterium]|nr:peptidoglycan-binding protein [Opitutae bacterium]